jgi:hypothetical protein
MGKKMLILRGNSAAKGKYPDEEGKNIAWPNGALHVGAARGYAHEKGYVPIVLDVPGQPQSQRSPQAKAALKEFLEDEDIQGFYGFSGGGYNLRYILEYLASNKPDTLRRLDLIIVIGAPLQPTLKYEPARYNGIAQKKVHPAKWQPITWELVYRTNPPRSALPKGLPKGTGTHMFGPDVLLAGGWDDET